MVGHPCRTYITPCVCQPVSALIRVFKFLAAYPDSMLIPKQQPMYAVKGERVQIDCGILPGKLLQQYTINWYKSSTKMIVANNVIIPMGSPDGHYALNHSTLSLIINNVTEADTSAYYRCELIVRDPQVQQTYTYDILESNFITLIILGMFLVLVSTYYCRTDF